VRLDIERIKELYDDWDMLALEQGSSAEGKAWDFMDEVPGLIAEVETLRKALDQAVGIAVALGRELRPDWLGNVLDIPQLPYPKLAAFPQSI